MTTALVAIRIDFKCPVNIINEQKKVFKKRNFIHIYIFYFQQTIVPWLLNLQSIKYVCILCVRMSRQFHLRQIKLIMNHLRFSELFSRAKKCNLIVKHLRELLGGAHAKAKSPQ